MANQKGFSLIEVLVATVIFSLLMMLVSFSLKQGLFIWSQQQGSFQQVLVQQKQILRLVNSIEQIYPYKPATDVNNLLDNKLYFRGEEQFVEYVSISGIFFPEPTMTRLNCVTTDRGALSLVVRERNEWTGELQEGELISDLTECNFSYLVHAGVNLSNVVENRKRSWVNSYSAFKTGFLPLQIKLNCRRAITERAECSLQQKIMINDERRQEILSGTVDDDKK